MGMGAAFLPATDAGYRHHEEYFSLVLFTVFKMVGGRAGNANDDQPERGVDRAIGKNPP